MRRAHPGFRPVTYTITDRTLLHLVNNNYWFDGQDRRGCAVCSASASDGLHHVEETNNTESRPSPREASEPPFHTIAKPAEEEDHTINHLYHHNNDMTNNHQKYEHQPTLVASYLSKGIRVDNQQSWSWYHSSDYQKQHLSKSQRVVHRQRSRRH